MTSLDDTTVPMKRCSRGEQCINPLECWLPATREYFYGHSGVKSGLQPQCKKCQLAGSKRYQEKNREKIKEKQKQYYLRNAEEFREKQRRWRAENPDRVRQAWEQWEVDNPESAREAQRQWQRSHPETARASAMNRKARKLAAEGSYNADDIKAQLERQKGRCFYCNCKLGKYEVDHVIPLVRGGSNYPSNLVIACPVCNKSKGAKLPHEWEGSGGKLL